MNARKSGVGNNPANGETPMNRTIPCQTLNIKNGVTTKGDECSPVEQNLSLLEVRGI